MIVKLLLLLIFAFKASRCSLIIDSTHQKGLYLSDYCPNMKYCREGSHVMCMFYDPNNVIGPLCYNAVNITITADLANQLLDVSNTIRSKIANGKETGKDGVLLPRGYGIFRLKWDNELATFAQVLANQCVLRHDMCRATKRFPNPSQTAGLVRFTFPDWEPMSKVKGITPTPGVTNAKLVYAITQSLKSWYAHKSSVTEEMVKVYPDWSATPMKQLGRLYLDMIHGPATHMGCGMSGYSEYVYYENHRQGIHNSLQVICNFSAGARKGTHSYETEPPIPGQGFSSKCGCPPGSEEDNDCLCNEVITPPPASPEPTCPLSEPPNNCDPTLVLLPIFTMEDAPPEKLYEMAEDIKDPLKNFILQRMDNTTDAIERQGSSKHERAQSSAEIFDVIHPKEEKVAWQRSRNPSSAQSPAPAYTTLRREKQAPAYRLGANSKPPPPPPRKTNSFRSSRPALRTRPPPPLPPPHPPLPPPRLPPPPPPPMDEYNSEQKDHKDLKPTASAVVRLKEKRIRPLPKLPSLQRPKAKKASLFTRVAQFQLPKRRIMTSPLKVIKKDVAPRKDFSNLNKVVHDYLKSRPGYRIFNDNREQNKLKEEAVPPTEDKSQTDVLVTDTGLDNVEETVINFNQYLSPKNNSNFNDQDVEIKDDNDNKLLSLLDTLEREVKHIALDGNEKELFDAKIRKIYGTIVGKAARLKFPKPVLLSTADTEPLEIDFGDAKVNDQFESDHDDDNHVIVTEEPKQRSRYKGDQNIGRVRNYDQSHKRKNKFVDSTNQKYRDKMDVFANENRKAPSGSSYDHKYNEHLDHEYGDINHKHMDDLDRKYNDNINNKYSENHLDHEHKFSDNFHHQHNYDDNELTSRSKIKYGADRAVFREFGHNSLDTHEDTTHGNYRYRDIKDNHDTPDVPLIAKDREKRKRNDRKHRKRVKSLNTRDDLSDHNDPLSLERRKYYQEKLDNIRKKLRNRKNRGNNDSRNERSLRRMHTKNREGSRLRSKSPADNFYMPERARFLHGF